MKTSLDLFKEKEPDHLAEINKVSVDYMLNFADELAKLAIKEQNPWRKVEDELPTENRPVIMKYEDGYTTVYKSDNAVLKNMFRKIIISAEWKYIE